MIKFVKESTSDVEQLLAQSGYYGFPVTVNRCALSCRNLSNGRSYNTPPIPVKYESIWHFRLAASVHNSHSMPTTPPTAPAY